MKQAALRKIVLEEYQYLKQNNLIEYYAQSRIEAGFTPEKPWPNKSDEDALKRFGAKPFSNGVNLHGYELDFKNPSERLWFYHDGEVWSTSTGRELGYDIKGNVIDLWNEPGANDPGRKSGFKVGSITKQGNKLILKLIKTAEPGEKESKPNTTIDTIQTVLDWAGLIPGIGDAIDVVNALIYFARGKYFDGFLSAIAVIPIVGSAIKLSAKAIYKGTKLYKIEELIKNSFKSKNATDVWADLAREGVISTGQLKNIGSGLDSLAGMLRGFTSKVKGVTSNQTVLKQLDDLETWMRANGKAASELTPASIRSLKAGKGAFKAASEVKGIEKLVNFVSAGTYKRLRKLTFFNDIKVKRIADGIAKRFAKEMKDPTKLTALIKTAPEGFAAMQKQIGGQFIKKFNVMDIADQTRIANRLGFQDPKYVALWFSNPANFQKSNELTKIFTGLKKVNPGLYDSIADPIIKTSKENGSILWTSFANDRLVNLKTALDPRYMQQIDMSLRKNADIIWNEVHDMFEDVGVELRPGQMTTDAKYDELDGLIWPTIKQGVAKFMPGVYDSANDIAKWTRSTLDSPIVQGAEQFLRDKSQDPYAIDSTSKGRYQ
jgi:hypothetical protein